MELKPGMFVKTRGASDRVGLRRIAAILDNGHLLVDHYTWQRSKNWHEEPKVFRAVRAPYASVIMRDKVAKIVNLDENFIFVSYQTYKP